MIFEITKPEPNIQMAPIIISVPHAGIKFPEDIQNQYRPHHLEFPQDTDWFVDHLYRFSKKSGIQLVKANLSRYVVDLNRHYLSEKLYDESRLETGVFPLKTFSGDPLYQSNLDPKLNQPYPREQQERLKKYYFPYYNYIASEIKDLKKTYKHVVFLDAHSIKRYVPHIQKKPFPDLIIGDREGKSASPKLIKTALNSLSKGRYDVKYNTPFKGGHLTQFFGDPENGIHAIQLEKSQDLYLNNNSRPVIDPIRSHKLSHHLEKTLNELIYILKEL